MTTLNRPSQHMRPMGPQLGVKPVTTGRGPSAIYTALVIVPSKRTGCGKVYICVEGPTKTAWNRSLNKALHMNHGYSGDDLEIHYLVVGVKSIDISQISIETIMRLCSMNVPIMTTNKGTTYDGKEDEDDESDESDESDKKNIDEAMENLTLRCAKETDEVLVGQS